MIIKEREQEEKDKLEEMEEMLIEQFYLLAEKSKTCEAEKLENITNSMINIFNTIISFNSFEN